MRNEEKGNIDTAGSSFSQEDMMQNIVAELKLLHSQRTQKFETTIAAKLSTDLTVKHILLWSRLEIWLLITHLYHG